MPRHRCLELGKRRVRIKLGSSRRRADVVLDLCCGTATSASKYYLLNNKNAIVIGIDRFKTKNWVEGHLKDLPQQARDRFFFFREDMATLDVTRLSQLIRQCCWSARVSHVTRVHWSPPCETLSRATRGRSGYRDQLSQPTKWKARLHDRAFEAGVELICAVRRLAPRALYTIESPYGDHFMHLPGVRRLLSDNRWRLLCGSHCKCAGKFDGGPWPQKDTSWLVSGVGRNFNLPLCEKDCSFLIPGTRRHKLVICSGVHNHPEQMVLKDPMVKGMIPLGTFHRFEEAHQDWLRRGQSYNVEEADSGASTESEEASSEEDMAQPDEMGPLDETLVNSDGQIQGEVIQPLRSSVPKLEVEGSKVPHWAIAYPHLFQNGRWNVPAMQPDALWFFDIISFDFRVRHKRQHVLIAYSLVSGSIRVRLMRSKSDAGVEANNIITMEALDKRDYKVTISGDGCGAVGGSGNGGGLVRQAALDRRLDWFPLEPNRPQHNPIEGMIASFKADVASVLLPAIRGGGIDESFVGVAAEYCAATSERYAQIRDYRRGDHRSAFELNTGVEPDPSHMVPFAMPGHAYVPPEVRKRRGTPKYMRAEPVLMLGYQHVYSKVYKCLTRHNTIIHTSQVQWLPGTELGVFPGLSRDAPALITKPALDTGLFDKPVKADKKGKATEKSAPLGANLSGTIRLNRDKVYPAHGTGPKPYILDRVVAVDGLSVEEARMMKFPDKHGKAKRYSGDIAYDAATGWIIIEMPGNTVMSVMSDTTEPQTAAQLSEMQAADPKAADPQPTDPQSARKSLFTKVIGLDRPHPEGEVSTVISRHRRRFVNRMLRRRPCPRPNHIMRGRGMPRQKPRRCAHVTATMHEARAYMGMRDLPWKKYLHGDHRAQVLQAYEKELASLLSTVLRELKPGDEHWEAALKSATPCRALLEFKRIGVWKARVVVRGDLEDREALDGPDFNYSSDVVGMAAVRAMLLGPRKPGDAIAQLDISTAFLQSDLFPPESPPRYLKLRDPVTGETRYFQQLGVVYGSGSSPVRWQQTLNTWLKSVGFEQGKNDPCIFLHKKLGVTLCSYVDDLLIKSDRATVEHVLKLIGERFQCKDPTFLGVGSPLDHLGMYFEETEDGTYLSMHEYIDSMVIRLDMEGESPGKVQLPISKPIDDSEPASAAEGKWLLRACGCLGWLAGTGRCDVRLAHSRISQYMAAPTKGAVEAARQAVKYCMATRELCLYQPHSLTHEWRHFSDSDHAGNAEVGNKRRSQLGYVSMYGTAPIGWGSKVSSVTFDGWANESLPSRGKSLHPCNTPTCHSGMKEIHADVSSGAAEIYAASVALSETLHMSYIADELGMDMPTPIGIHVDNAAAIAFSQGQVRRTKLKHIDVRQAWVQAMRDSEICVLYKVDTSENLADFFTKILDVHRFTGLRDQMMKPHRCMSDKTGACKHQHGTVTALSGGLTGHM